MSVVTTTTTTTRILCPNCGEPGSSIDHLKPGYSWGPWNCGECGAPAKGVTDDAGGTTVALCGGTRSWRHSYLCRARIRDTSLSFDYVGMGWGPGPEEPGMAEMFEHQRYWIEEHTCPINLLGSDVVEFYDGEEKDPHGVFELVSMRWLGPGKKRPSD